MNRRAFLCSLAALAAGLALDPERALWVPGAKSIFLPASKPSLVSPIALTKGDIFTVEGVYAVNPRYRVTPHLMQFVVTDDVSAGDVQIAHIYPRPIDDGIYMNVNHAPTPRARIHPLLTGRTISTSGWSA